MTTPTASEWLWHLTEQPEGYGELLAIHEGHMASACWLLAHVRLQAVGHPGPPCAGDLLSAGLMIGQHAGVRVPDKHSLAADAAAAGYSVSGY